MVKVFYKDTIVATYIFGGVNWSSCSCRQCSTYWRTDSYTFHTHILSSDDYSITAIPYFAVILPNYLFVRKLPRESCLFLIVVPWQPCCPIGSIRLSGLTYLSTSNTQNNSTYLNYSLIQMVRPRLLTFNI